MKIYIRETRQGSSQGQILHLQVWKVDKLRHRQDGPAVKRSDGFSQWYHKGKLHRLDGPATVDPNGGFEWRLDGLRHRDDGPAIVTPYVEEWYQHGLVHREDGPAIVRDGGAREWYRHGKRHRLDGPAIDHADKTRHRYYVEDLLIDLWAYPVEVYKYRWKQSADREGRA